MKRENIIYPELFALCSESHIRIKMKQKYLFPVNSFFILKCLNSDFRKKINYDKSFEKKNMIHHIVTHVKYEIPLVIFFSQTMHLKV